MDGELFILEKGSFNYNGSNIGGLPGAGLTCDASENLAKLMAIRNVKRF
jgi:hypothetical protein